MSGPNRDLLTLPDVCAELGVSRSTFYDWRAKGRAPRCIKLPNGEIRVRRSELDRWLAELEEGVEPVTPFRHQGGSRRRGY